MFANKKSAGQAPIVRLLGNMWQNDRNIYLLCVLFTIVALAVPFFPVVLPKVLIGYLTGPSPELGGIITIAGVFFAAGAVFYFLKQWVDDLAYPRITALRIDYVRDMAVKLLGIDYKYMESATFFDDNQTAFDAPNGNDNGVEGIYHKLFNLPSLVLLVLVFSVFIGLCSPLILLALLVNITASAFAALRVQKYQYKRRDELSRHERRVGYYSKTAKDFAYGKDVRVYSLSNRVTENFKAAIKGYTDVFRVIKNREYAYGFLTLATLLVSDLAAYGILTYKTSVGMSVADFTMYVAAVAALNAQLTALSDNITYIMREHMYVRDFFKFLDTDLGETGGSLLAPPAGTPIEIEFKNVTFRYPGTDKNIFENFSLRIPAGQKLAIVGVNGAGKTTFVKLLTGMFRPDSGQILISGRDAGEYKKSELYGMFAAVFQEVNIIALTVAENIACRRDNIDYTRVDETLCRVGLYDKVKSLPAGVNTMMLKIIDENGAVFSGGESQKLAIARALYKGGNCVIMDEPTAALDALAEAEIYSGFDSLTEGKTAIYISHRLASTKFCDKIALIDGTGLIEYGTHDELMKQGGVYRDMFVTQGKYYQQESAAV